METIMSMYGKYMMIVIDHEYDVWYLDVVS